MDNPYVPGEVVEVKFRGVDPSIPVGSKEWKKEKRLADNRASAARSRAMERLKKNALEVSGTQSLDEDSHVGVFFLMISALPTLWERNADNFIFCRHNFRYLPPRMPA